MRPIGRRWHVIDNRDGQRERRVFLEFCGIGQVDFIEQWKTSRDKIHGRKERKEFLAENPTSPSNQSRKSGSKAAPILSSFSKYFPAA